MTESEVIAPPAPYIKGTYAIYEMPDGGRVIAYRAEGQEESQQIVLPGPLMRMIDHFQETGEPPSIMDMARMMKRGG